MDFEKLLKMRRSVRSFRPDPLPEGAIDRISDAANSAPSAGNLQAYSFYFVEDRKIKEKIAERCYGQMFIAGAPVVFAFFAEPDVSARKYGERGAAFYSLQDATIAAAYAQLAAADMGLGTVWIGAFDDAGLQEAFRTGARPVCVLPVGFPEEEGGKVRKQDRLHTIF